MKAIMIPVQNVVNGKPGTATDMKALMIPGVLHTMDSKFGTVFRDDPGRLHGE